MPSEVYTVKSEKDKVLRYFLDGESEGVVEIIRGFWTRVVAEGKFGHNFTKVGRNESEVEKKRGKQFAGKGRPPQYLGEGLYAGWIGQEDYDAIIAQEKE